jgi:hypothetical protein
MPLKSRVLFGGIFAINRLLFFMLSVQERTFGNSSDGFYKNRYSTTLRKVSRLCVIFII